MKTIALLLAMLLGTFVQAQTQDEGILQVEVPNVQSAEGAVLFALYTESNFMKPDAGITARSEIMDGKASVSFDNLAPGTYAILVLHDKNNNQKMDFDSNGMPLENFGSSGDTINYAPPNWPNSQFKFEGGTKTIEIRF
ncbi:DUF2141 domain-containing protein [Christiangramia salexigens]|uniref:DUF2141 domain-containing protein n=1 Tax=Christiangramia salexigens TaxID=1913577 RepID=A0A1L3J3U1_9FLAO|nr:DUF2141 domain-containing protein [Christiangramia salexigens]APG59786.1 hypothetical protein LPB144_04860 [Christiangramia salexigens]